MQTDGEAFVCGSQEQQLCLIEYIKEFVDDWTSDLPCKAPQRLGGGKSGQAEAILLKLRSAKLGRLSMSSIVCELTNVSQYSQLSKLNLGKPNELSK